MNLVIVDIICILYILFFEIMLIGTVFVTLNIVNNINYVQKDPIYTSRRFLFLVQHDADSHSLMWKLERHYYLLLHIQRLENYRSLFMLLILCIDCIMMQYHHFLRMQKKIRYMDMMMT